jgi:hypothetical protein
MPHVFVRLFVRSAPRHPTSETGIRFPPRRATRHIHFFRMADVPHAHALVLDLVGTLLTVVFSRSALFGGFFWLLSALLRLALFAPHVALAALTPAPLAAATLGTVLGVALVRMLHLPRLIDPLLLPEHPRARRALIPDVGLWLGAATSLAVLCIRAAQQARAGAMLASTAGALLATLAAFVLVTLWLLDSRFDAYTKGQNLKYAAALVALLVVPPLAAHAVHHVALEHAARGARRADVHTVGPAALAAACHLAVAAVAHAFFFWYAGHVGVGQAVSAHARYGSFALYPRFLAVRTAPDTADVLESGGTASNGAARPVFVAVQDRMGGRAVALVFATAVGLGHMSFLAADAALHIVRPCPTSVQELVFLAVMVVLWLSALATLTARTDQDALVGALARVASAPSWRAAWQLLCTVAPPVQRGADVPRSAR